MPQVQDLKLGKRLRSLNANPGIIDLPPEMPTKTARVLIVDDGAENQHLLRVILGKAGLDVDSAENGVVALEKAEESLAVGRPFHLIIMDMQMPEMDGYEATRRLRRDGWERPIVALTAFALPGDRERCLAAGCDEYLPKPVDRGRLLDTIGRFLDRPITGAAARPNGGAPRSLLDDPRISPADRARIVNSFLGSLAERMARIQQALLEDNRELLITEVHAVAGTAGLLGFARLSDDARALERDARQGASFDALQVGGRQLTASARAAGQHSADG